MKKILVFIAAFAALLLCPVLIFAQVVDTTGLSSVDFKNITPDQANQYAQFVFGAIVIIWGYIAKAFKLKPRNVDFVFVVVAGGVVVGGVFIAAGWAQALQIAVSLFVSLSVYRVVLKPGKTAIQSALNRNTTA